MSADEEGQEARARISLAETSRRRIDRPRDRWVHAGANVMFGLLIGGWIGLGRLDRQDGSSSPVILLGYMFLLIGVATWQTRAARTWPRGARRTSWVGLAGTVALGAVVHMALNWREQSHPVSSAQLVAASVLIALPLVASGVVIATRRRR